MEAIQRYLRFDDVNGTVRALHHFLSGGESTIQLALGRGRYGCVFQVRSEFLNAEFALKIIATDSLHPNPREEYQRLVEAGNIDHNLIVGLLPQVQMFTEQFVYYGLSDVGNHADIQGIPARPAFMHLCLLHKAGIIHGDPRISNIILLADGTLRWIDLRYPPTSILKDVMILIEQRG